MFIYMPAGYGGVAIQERGCQLSHDAIAGP
jgi:hypothetical protein